MRSPRSLTFVLVAAFCLAAMAAAQESKIRRSDLPPAVEKAVASLIPGATIRGFSREKENGRTYYETELTVNGHGKDILMDANGSIVEVEEEVAPDALSREVKDGLQARAGKGKLLKIESIRKHQKLVAYEAQVLSEGRRSEVQVGPDGKPLDHEQ
jgi:hypothetical protein